MTIVKDSSSFNSDCGGKHSKELLEEYCIGAIDKLQKSWFLPNKGWDENLKSGIVLQVLNDGTIDKAYFEIKSGDEEFDAYVIKAINKANPLPSIPASNCSCLEFLLVFKPWNKQ